MLSHAANDVASNAGFPPIALAQTGAAGVDLFFIVSGFVMVHSSAYLFGTPGARQLFFERRLWRVVPLYWAVTIFYVLMQYFRGHSNAFFFGHFAASMVFFPVANQSGSILPTYGIGWTLNYEMFFYAWFAAGLGLTFKRGVSLIAGTLLMLVLLHVLVDLPQPLRFWTHPVLLEFIFGLAFGAMFCRGFRLTPLAGRLVITCGLTALVAATVFGGGFSPDAPDQATLRWLFWGVPMGLCFAGTVLRRAAPLQPHPTVALLGDASYALYLIHPIVIILMRSVFPGLKTAMGGNATLAALCQLGLDGIIAIACAIIIHLGVERRLLRVSRRPPPVTARPAV